ncbi:MAG: hypothetical protein FWE61_06965 [Micrococcales bacterium]|nr:hypothetical protein [Micrococcales bacterium]
MKSPRRAGRLSVAAAVVAALVVTSLTGCSWFSKEEASDELTWDVASRGGSASVHDGKIELNGAVMGFGDNDVTQASLTEVVMHDGDDPVGKIGKTWSLELPQQARSEVTFSAPVDTSKVPDGEVFLTFGTIMRDAPSRAKTINYSHIPATVSNGVATVSFVPSDYLQDFSVKWGGAVAEPTGDACRGVGSDPDGGANPTNGYWEKYKRAVDVNSQKAKGFLAYTAAVPWETKNGKIVVYGIDLAFQGNARGRQDLLADAQAAYEHYTVGRGWSFDPRKSLVGSPGEKFDDRTVRTAWPIRIFFETIPVDNDDGAKDRAQYRPPVFTGGWQNGALVIDPAYANDPTTTKALLFHEMLHVIQSNYVADYGKTRWVDEATAAYYEWQSVKVRPSNYEPYSVIWNLLPPANMAKSHHYSYASVIKYLADNYGDGHGGKGEQFIRAMYTDQSADWDAKLEKYSESRWAWNVSFYERHLSNTDGVTGCPLTFYTSTNNGGGGYGMRLAKYTEDDVTAAATDGRTLALGDHEVAINPYSANLVGLNPMAYRSKADGHEFPDGFAPTVSLSGSGAAETELRVFKVSKTSSQMISPANGVVVLDDFATASDNGYRYVALLVSRSSTPLRTQVNVTLGAEKPTSFYGRYQGRATVKEAWFHGDVRFLPGEVYEHFYIDVFDSGAVDFSVTDSSTSPFRGTARCDVCDATSGTVQATNKTADKWGEESYTVSAFVDGNTLIGTVMYISRADIYRDGTWAKNDRVTFEFTLKKVS